MAKLVGEFLCPACKAKLRIQQAGQNEATISCPECGETLRVQQDDNGRLKAVVGQAAAPESLLPPAPKKNPIGAILTGLLVVAVLAAGWYATTLPGDSEAPDETEQLADQDNDPEAQGPVQPEPEPEPAPEPTPETTVPDDVPEQHPFAQKLAALGTRVSQYQTENGLFPPALWEQAGPVTGEEFSWLAGLDPALQSDSTLLPQWNLAWDNPLNERFVRRKREDLLNPDIRLQASPDRYPASHVVGVAGVGDDAAQLPVDHPRAGIFGWKRSTRVEDVKDGLSNTMLGVGVTGKLHSWASGKGSVRAFTMEPYINGPDGFGTGQKDGMHVLMADGSVKFVSKQTSPLIIRRMAAMADGLPLDADVPGEPGETIVAEKPEPAPKPEGDPEGNPNPEQPPMTAENTPNGVPPTTPDAVPEPPEPAPPEMADTKPAVDFEKVLGETVLVYQLTSDAPLDQVLAELEALIGARIDFATDKIPTDDPRRRQPVNIDRKNVSYRDLLDDVLDETAFSYTLQRDHIAIVPKEKDE